MKKYLLFLLMLLPFALTGCNTEEERASDGVFMYATSGTVEAVGSVAGQPVEKPITIQVTGNWTAEVSAADAAWLSLDRYKGEKGMQEVVLICQPNDGAARTGKVIFTCGAYSETYTVTQKGI